MSKAPYTQRQKQYLAFIAQYTDLMRIAPSESDIAAYFGVSGPSVHQMIVTLEEKGAISKIPGAARTIRLLDQDLDLPWLGWPKSSFRGDEKEPAGVVGAFVEFADFLVWRICCSTAMDLPKLGSIRHLSADVGARILRHGASAAFVEKMEAHFEGLLWLSSHERRRGRMGSRPRAPRIERAEPRPERPKKTEAKSVPDDPRQGRLFD